MGVGEEKWRARVYEMKMERRRCSVFLEGKVFRRNEGSGRLD